MGTDDVRSAAAGQPGDADRFSIASAAELAARPSMLAASESAIVAGVFRSPMMESIARSAERMERFLGVAGRSAARPRPRPAVARVVEVPAEPVRRGSAARPATKRKRRRNGKPPGRKRKWTADLTSEMVDALTDLPKLRKAKGLPRLSRLQLLRQYCRDMGYNPVEKFPGKPHESADKRIGRFLEALKKRKQRKRNGDK